jgi:SAM-dependent methyltransferase
VASAEDRGSPAGTDDPALKELRELIREVQEKVRARHATEAGGVRLPDLLPLLHARDAAEGKVASIGTVNPRRSGPLNALIQAVKKTVARALDWHVREQVEFNRAAVAALDAVREALEENNRALRELSTVLDAAEEIRDTRSHWNAWRLEWERKLQGNELQYLRGLADLQAAFDLRVTQHEASFRDAIKAQHREVESWVERAAGEIHDRLAARYATALRELRSELESLIHSELRLLRQRSAVVAPAPPVGAAPSAEASVTIDWLKFAEKFRGKEEDIRGRHGIYVERFRGCDEVVDLGCGRGEFLEVMREAGIAARGIELSGELVGLCREKGLQAEHADMFAWLDAQPERSLHGMFCSQVIEHLSPGRLPELVRLAYSKLHSRSVLAFETPNPECLAIFATHFYIDPTHVRPVPPKLLAFYLEEQGFGEIQVLYLEPAEESMPELKALPEPVRRTFFGALDYAIVARKL